MCNHHSSVGMQLNFESISRRCNSGFCFPLTSILNISRWIQMFLGNREGSLFASCSKLGFEELLCNVVLQTLFALAFFEKLIFWFFSFRLCSFLVHNASSSILAQQQKALFFVSSFQLLLFHVRVIVNRALYDLRVDFSVLNIVVSWRRLGRLSVFHSSWSSCQFPRAVASSWLVKRWASHSVERFGAPVLVLIFKALSDCCSVIGHFLFTRITFRSPNNASLVLSLTVVVHFYLLSVNVAASTTWEILNE